MNFAARLAATTLATLIPLGAGAASDIDTIRSVLEKANPALNIRSIAPAPIAGLYEVYANGNILYVDQGARHVLAGARLLEVSSRRDLTTERMKELTTIRFDSLPFQDAITIKKGSGAYRFAVFSDPDCPYCKSLETGLAKLGLSDYTAYVFLFPLPELHPEARAKAESIWCATDRIAAWNAWMLEGKLPEKKTCDTPVDRIAKLADELGVGGTPTIYLENGNATNAPQELVDAIRQKQQGKKP